MHIHISSCLLTHILLTHILLPHIFPHPADAHSHLAALPHSPYKVYEEMAAKLEAEAAAAAAEAANGATAAADASTSGRLSDEQGGQLWVQYMRFLRRSVGMKEARQVGSSVHSST